MKLLIVNLAEMLIGSTLEKILRWREVISDENSKREHFIYTADVSNFYQENHFWNYQSKNIKSDRSNKFFLT